MKAILLILYFVAANAIFFVCGYKCGVRALTHIIDKKIEEYLNNQDNERSDEGQDNADGRIEG